MYTYQFANSMSTPRCLVINPSARTVCVRDMPTSIDEIQALVESKYFTIGMRLKNGDILYVDEEAELAVAAGRPAPAAFTVEGCRLLGNAVVVRIDSDTGKDCTPSTALAALVAAVTF